MTLTIALAILAAPTGVAYPPSRVLPVTRAWHLDGPGPARYGWGWHHPTGRVVYLGETWVGVRDQAERVYGLALLRTEIDAALAEAGAE